MQNGFPDAIHLQCFEHFQDVCESKLCALNISVGHQEVLADIFGVEGLEQRQFSLVDAIDSEFDAKLVAVEEQWYEVERENAGEWFQEKLSNQSFTLGLSGKSVILYTTTCFRV